MSDSPFVLNNRFTIDPSRGSILDRQINKESRIEPRLMKLLCLLAKNNGELVNRPTITKEIWDDYGNADEGLTQAISYLRKVLADEHKSLIETVPKKGYILHAELGVPHKNEPEKLPAKTNPKKLLLLTGLFFILLIMAYVIYRAAVQKQQTSPDVLQQGQKAGTLQNKVNNPDTFSDPVKHQHANDDQKK